MKTFQLFRGIRILAGCMLGVLLLASLGESAIAASTWNPTLLVNTESFQIVDEGDGTTNIEIRFGQTLQQKLFFDRSNNRFVFTSGLLVGGNLTATGSLSVKRNISGASLRVDGPADFWGTVSATGAIKTRSTLTINSDSDTNDAILTFGNQTADQTLKFLNGVQQYEFSKGLRVNGDLSASGTLSVQTAINTRGDLTLNVERGAGDATLTFGNATTNQTIKYNDTLQKFQVSKDLRVNGALSGKTLIVDDTVTLNGVAYEFTGAQGGTNTFLKNDGAGNLTWATTSVGNGSGGVLSLHPEYPNAVYYQSGSTAVGTMTYSYDSTNKQNYYRWTTSKPALQDYWVSVRVMVPKNFVHFQTSSGIVLRLRSNTTAAADNYTTLRLYDTAGAEVAITGNASLRSGTANTWDAKAIGGTTAGTYTPGGYITILMKVASTNAGFLDLGNIDLNWTTTTP